MANSLCTNISKPRTPVTFSQIQSRIFPLFFLLCILGLYSFYYHHSQNSQNALRFIDIFLASATNFTVASYLRDLTLHPHLAGTKSAFQTARYVKTHFESLGLDTVVKDYRVMLSYPTQSSLAAHFIDGTVREFPMIESGLDKSDVVRPYHAYSPSGSAWAKPVFVNYGREEDYRAVKVSVSGCIVIVRRGGFSRGGVVAKAAEKGVVAVLMYTEDNGEGEGGGGRGGVERGTVMLGGIGDPLSPGWGAGADGGESLGFDDAEVLKKFPKIPSMPISANIAYAILGLLEGPRAPLEWRDNLKMRTVRVGPGPVMLNFTYQVSQLALMIVQ